MRDKRDESNREKRLTQPEFQLHVRIDFESLSANTYKVLPVVDATGVDREGLGIAGGGEIRLKGFDWKTESRISRLRYNWKYFLINI